MCPARPRRRRVAWRCPPLDESAIRWTFTLDEPPLEPPITQQAVDEQAVTQSSFSEPAFPEPAITQPSFSEPAVTQPSLGEPAFG